MSDNQENTLRKYNIGTEKRPFPMTYSFQNRQGRTEYDLGVLQSDEAPIKIYSEKEYSEVVGMMYRDMPTPSMLEVFKEGQIQRTPENKRKVEFFMGDAGAGKSFLGNLNAKMRCKKGAMLVDCGGRDLNELIYETVLDYEAGKTVFDAIDQKLAAGEMNPASVNELRSKLGNAVKKDGDKISIDWEEVGVARADEKQLEDRAAQHQARLELSDEDLKSLDNWDRRDENTNLDEPTKDLQGKYEQYKQAIESDSANLYKDAEQDRESALAVIRNVADAEGLNQDGNASIGLKTREGALIRAWKENRPIILDEYNKAKPGTDDALQILWQVFTGEMENHTVTKGGESFTFDREEMPENFFVTLTGNKTRDGYSTRSLSASAYQRLKPVYIEPPTVEDLQHRICQKLTGMPVSTIYKAQEEYWSEHKEQFTDFLVDMRKRGLSEEQQSNIPSWQFEMLKNWDNVLDASHQLATLYDRWAQVVDPDSPLYENATGQTAEILGEVDKQFAAEIGIGLRRMMSHMDGAEIITPEAGKSKEGISPDVDWDSPDDLDEVEAEPTERRFGTRLSKNIIKDINDTSKGKDKLLGYLLKQAAEAGLFAMVLEEGRSTGDRLISDLLDIDPDKEKEIPENIEEIHEVLCDYLRSKFPDIDPEVENSDVISPSALEHVLAELNGMDEVKRLTTRSGELQLPSIDTTSEELFTTGVGVETRDVTEVSEFAKEEEKATYEKIIEEEQEIRQVNKLPTESLVDSERFLISLAIPGASTNNINALFSPETEGIEEKYIDGIQQVAGNTSPSGLAATLVMGKAKDENGEERDEFLHVVHDSFGNNNEGRTLVTGTTEISPRLQKALENNGITYVNRNDENAAEKINEALDDITKDKKDIENADGMCVDNVLAMVTGHRTGLEVVDKVKKGIQNVDVYDLPHGDIHDADAPPVMTDEIRGQHRENLVALLSDERDYIKKAVDNNRMATYVLTDSPDIDHLKNTIRSLTNDGPKQAAGMGK